MTREVDYKLHVIKRHGIDIVKFWVEYFFAHFVTPKQWIFFLCGIELVGFIYNNGPHDTTRYIGKHCGNKRRVITDRFEVDELVSHIHPGVGSGIAHLVTGTSSASPAPGKQCGFCVSVDRGVLRFRCKLSPACRIAPAKVRFI